MIKVINPVVVKIVGVVASVLLRHIKYWKDSSQREVIHRTNSELVTDLQGMFSESQIQRAKKKLVDHGLILISYGKGYNRTTHFTLTEKAKELLNHVDDVNGKNKSNSPSTPKSPVESKKAPNPYKRTPYKVNKQQGDVVTPEHYDNRPASMKKAFDEYGKAPEGVKKGIPDHLRSLLGLKSKESNVKTDANLEDIQHNNDTPMLTNNVLDVIEESENNLCDDDYYVYDCSQGSYNNNSTTTVSTNKSIGFKELMSAAFSQIPNIDILETNRHNMEMMRDFKEDY